MPRGSPSPGLLAAVLVLAGATAAPEPNKAAPAETRRVPTVGDRAAWSQLRSPLNRTGRGGPPALSSTTSVPHSRISYATNDGLVEPRERTAFPLGQSQFTQCGSVSIPFRPPPVPES